MRILIFGDSITQGFFDIEGGWVNTIRRHYDGQRKDINDFPPAVFNLGVDGDSSSKILARFENEVKARLWPGSETAIVISSGVNDSIMIGGENFSDTNRYHQNLSDLLKLARKYSGKIMFIGLTPCVESRSNPFSWDSNIACTAKRIQEFDTVLRNFCDENDVPFVEILKPFQDKQVELELLPDGIHPNQAGHKLLVELIQPQLEKLIK